MGMENVIDKIVKTFEGKYTPEYERECRIKLLLDNELAPDKIEFPPSYFQKTDNLLENARLYEEVLEKIREKYKYHLVDTPWFSIDDKMHREIKRESYCKKFNLSSEDLEYVAKDVKLRIDDEVRLSEIDFLIRDDNYSVYELEEAIKLEGRYGSKERVAELGKMLEVAKVKWEEINRGKITKTNRRDSAKWSVTCRIMSDIKLNVNPHWGKERETKFQNDWVKKLNLLKERLKEKGIYLNQRYEADRKHEAVIEQTWQEINKQAEKERDKRLGIKEIDLPPFDHDKFKEELLRRYPDPRRMTLSKEKFDQIRREFYGRQVAEYENKGPRSLNDRLIEARKSRSREIADKSATRGNIDHDKGNR